MLFVLRVVNGEALAGLVVAVVEFLEFIDLINKLADVVVLEFFNGVAADLDGDMAFDKLLRLHGLIVTY